MLLGTALASSLIVLPLLMATPASAQVNCPGGNAPIDITANQPIVCINANDRTNNAGDAIRLETTGVGSYITVDNSGDLTAINNAGDAYGLRTYTNDDNSRITIVNSGDINVSADDDGYGIYAESDGENSPVTVTNSGDISVQSGGDGYGIYAYADQNYSNVEINNTGNIFVNAGDDAYGLHAETSTSADGSTVTVNNSGAITVIGGGNATGIYAYSDNEYGGVVVRNSGPISVTAVDDGYGIYVYSFDNNSPVYVNNSGAITVNAGLDGYGIYGDISDPNNPTTIINSGAITVTAGDDAYGIFVTSSDGPNSGVTIVNSGNMNIVGGDYADGIDVDTDTGNPVSITNSGNITVQGVNDGDGIDVDTDDDAPITIVNSGSIVAQASGAVARADGLELESDLISPIQVFNSGSIYGQHTGIYSDSQTSTTINNLAGGSISAGAGLAINIEDAAGRIFNAGTINGFVDLTDNPDLFQNLQGGVFNAAGTSLFGMGDDKFQNRGVVQIGSNAGVMETAFFQGLETFENDGNVSLQDGGAGDAFTISNTVGGTDLNYIGGPKSILAVDAVLNENGFADTFTIEGNALGQTIVQVNNVAPPSVFTNDTIPVIFVTGPNVDASNFVLERPVDAGFFNYDLFFVDTGSGFFELRNIGPGGGAFLLPQLITASQDIWHETSDTWFDRSADLRAALRHGGAVPGVPGAMYLGGRSVKDGVVAAPGGLTPGVWAKVSHGELEFDGGARTSAFGRNYSYDLGRELYIIDVQAGVDFTFKGVMNPSDVLLFSVFGGGVSANLQYDNLGGRRFDYEGGQAGLAATYLSGGLFVDALFNAQFLEIEPEAFGFSQDLDADSYGFRVDTGYRFERGRFFFEPLLTLAYVDSDIDGFSFAGNTVSFQAEDSLRGRAGLRAGTSLLMGPVRFEPFAIASVWGELSDDDNRATLVSNGSRFSFRDNDRDDSWGEISLGTNTFLAGSNAFSAFSKIDLIFGDDVDGYIASGGFRVQW